MSDTGGAVKYVLSVRRKVERCTDPQRRCYNGCFFSSEIVWTDWDELLAYKSKEDVEDTMATFQRANPTHEYKIEERVIMVPTKVMVAAEK